MPLIKLRSQEQQSSKAESVFYAKLVNFNSGNNPNNQNHLLQSNKSMHSDEEEEAEAVESSSLENDYSDICEYTEPELRGIRQLICTESELSTTSSKPIKIVEKSSTVMAKEATISSLYNQNKSSRSQPQHNQQHHRHHYHCSLTTSSNACSSSESSSSSSCLSNKIAAISPCLTEQIYETLSARLANFELPIDDGKQVKSTTITTTSTEKIKKQSSHAPFQSSSTLLLKKTSPFNNRQQQHDNDCNNKYSLITTQITKPPPAAVVANDCSRTPSSTLSTLSSSSSCSSSSSNNNNNSNNASYLIRHKTFEFNLDDLLLKNCKSSSTSTTNETNFKHKAINETSNTNNNTTSSSSSSSSSPVFSTSNNSNNNNINNADLCNNNNNNNNNNTLTEQKTTTQSYQLESTLLAPFNTTTLINEQQQLRSNNNSNLLLSSNTNGLTKSSSSHRRSNNKQQQLNTVRHNNHHHQHNHYHQQHNQTPAKTTKGGLKSASTSYLLSKISSITSLNMNKQHHQPYMNAATSNQHVRSNTTHSGTGSNHSPSSGGGGGNLMSNLANKTTRLFQRNKPSSSNQQQQIAAENNLTQSISNSYLLSASTTSIESPVQQQQLLKKHQYKTYSSSSSSSSPLAFNGLDSLNQIMKTDNNFNNEQVVTMRSVKSRSDMANSSNLNGTLTSRRPFKKRSQSTCQNSDKKLWYYNQNDDCWFTTSSSSSSSATASVAAAEKIKQNLTPTSRILIKKSSASLSYNNNSPKNTTTTNINVSPLCSVSICENINNSSAISAVGVVNNHKLRLIDICIKHLTLLELKYLKQICFNKVKKEYENLNTSGVIQQQIKLAIPKDESMKCIKAKNISNRSKSVDFRFFDEIKENYLFKISSQKDNSSDQMFGQSLYKCIINDLQQSSSINKTTTPLPTSSKSSKSSSRNRINPNNLLIASKYDLNRLNGFNTISSMSSISNQGSTASNLPTTPTSMTNDFYSKRNSVLFEALDLKNVKQSSSYLYNNKQNLNDVINECDETANAMDCTDDSLNNLKHQQQQRNRSRSTTVTKQTLINNQNLSIRSEGLVPNIVKSCCKHISEHGLDVVGIFRIDSSKKRIKEIKELFDSGKKVILDESYTPNDVACILKEYLRSLPEPLLTCDLYSAFLASCKIKDPAQRLHLVRCLVCLLPSPNRDTLEVLLKLLDKVRAYALPFESFSSDSTIVMMGGNKMDAFNLAMVFGPNLLKKHKISSNPMVSNSKLNDLAEKQNLIDDIDSVITCTKYLIENQERIFSIDAELHNELLQVINTVVPNEVNAILSRKVASMYGIQLFDINHHLNDKDDDITNINSEKSASNGKSSTDDLSSPSHSSSNNELDQISSQFKSSVQHNQSQHGGAIYPDFIDNNPDVRYRTSRTKLHKVNAANFNYLAAAASSSRLLVEPINFVSSPSNSPTNVPRMASSSTNNKSTSSSSSVSSSSSSSYKYNTYRPSTSSSQSTQQQPAHHSIDSYSQHHHHEATMTPKQGTATSCGQTMQMLSSSSLLLMIQNRNKQQQHQHQQTLKNIQAQQAYITMATKSLTSLNNTIATASSSSINGGGCNTTDTTDSNSSLNSRISNMKLVTANNYPIAETYRRQSGPYLISKCVNNYQASSQNQQQQHQHQINNTCAKFNLIGEQETLV